jgi:hypothetical protein
MNASTRLTMTLAILTMATTSSVFGQFPDEDDYSGRLRSVRPVASSEDFPELPASLSEFSSRRISNATPSDPFRRINREGRDLRSRDGEQVRYRVPLGNDYSIMPVDRFDSRSTDRPMSEDGYPMDDFRRETNYDRTYDPRSEADFEQRFERLPARRTNNDRFTPVDERDPFVPAPLPESRLDDEASKIDELLTIRYQNPVTVRAIRAMSTIRLCLCSLKCPRKLTNARWSLPATTCEFDVLCET